MVVIAAERREADESATDSMIRESVVQKMHQNLINMIDEKRKM